jgi:GNAT superfamily N-acetyltransferase
MTIEGRKDAFFETMREYWRAAGFELNSTRLRLTAEYDEDSVKALENEREVIHEVKVASPDRFEEGLALLLRVFDPVTSIFPGKDDMRRSMDDGNFLIIENDEGRIICIIECEFGKTSFKLWRIATDPDYTGQRFHWHCRRYATRKAFGMGLRRNIAWVEDWNAKSTHNITSMGMKFDGRISEQYILKGAD